MTSRWPRATFRDPAGSLSFEEDRVIRRIGRSSREGVLDFLASPFCVAMQQGGDLIGAEILDADGGDSSGELCLRHPKIAVPTYPWEWTPSQWLAAAELTLELCERALADGWILKDATPLNVLFVGSRPIFVDILSFERRDPHSSIWLAYGQYIRTFLLPLLMSRMMSWPLGLSVLHRDGYEPADCYAALGWSRRLGRDAFWPITLPALLDRRKGGEAPAKKRPARVADPEITASVLRRTLKDLRKRTRRAVAGDAAAESEWSRYQGTLTHYTAEESAEKLEWVRTVLGEVQPKRVLDVGANTGEYSALAASAGAEVVALERDAASADRVFRMARDRGLRIDTIHADLARPTPAVGWENAESMTLLGRLEGQFELVMLLAVIHHLVLMEQIPLAAIVELCARMTLRYLVIEWVPVSDPMYQSLMRGRDLLYGALSEDDLIAACVGRFEVVRRHALGNGRVLFLFEKVG
ncbi:MAG TPA: class I SAM-dependent methyltransferase [Acidobacteriaceae bacterium]|nr:class I SAM-dependent methyltransferase [Acidobacteriaceae bacterium]